MALAETEHQRDGLEPCIFCKARLAILIAQEVDGVPEMDTVYFVRCLGCYAQGPAGEERPAIERWNAAWQGLRHYATQMGRWVHEEQEQ